MDPVALLVAYFSCKKSCIGGFEHGGRCLSRGCRLLEKISIYLHSLLRRY